MMLKQDHQAMHQSSNDQSAESFKQRILRPMNSFMVWCRDQRNHIALDHPKMHNEEISKRLRAEWKLLSKEEKKPFADEAKRLRDQYKRDHPDYVYKCTRKRKPGAKTSKHVKPRKRTYIRRSMSANQVWWRDYHRKILSKEEKKPLIKKAKLLLAQNESSHPDYKCQSRRKTKAAAKTSEPLMPYILPYSEPTLNGINFMPSPPVPSYDAHNRHNKISNTIASYGMHFAPYKETPYASEVQSSGIQSVKKSTAFAPFFSYNSQGGAFAQNMERRESDYRSITESPLMVSYINPDHSLDGTSSLSGQQILPTLSITPCVAPKFNPFTTLQTDMAMTATMLNYALPLQDSSTAYTKSTSSSVHSPVPGLSPIMNDTVIWKPYSQLCSSPNVPSSSASCLQPLYGTHPQEYILVPSYGMSPHVYMPYSILSNQDMLPSHAQRSAPEIDQAGKKL